MNKLKKTASTLLGSIVLTSIIVGGGILNLNNSSITNTLSSSGEDSHNFQYLDSFIKETYNNNAPLLNITRNAAITNQISFLVSTAEVMLQKENNLNNKLDYSYMFLPTESLTKINLDAIKDFKNNDYNLENIDGNSKINIFSDFDENIVGSGAVDIYKIPLMIQKIKSLTNATSIDFMMDEIKFKEVVKAAIENPEGSVLEEIIKSSNKLIIASDGAWHSKNSIPFLMKLLEDNEFNKDEAIRNLKAIKDGTGHLTTKTIKDLFQLTEFDLNGKTQDDFIHYIHYDSRYINNIDNLYNISSFSTNYCDYEQLFKTQSVKEEYDSIQSSLFTNNMKTLSDIFVNGYDEYDNKKKNAIFLGSSLFRKRKGFDEVSRLEEFDHVRKTIQNELSGFLNKFPLDEYNIIFKLHPVYKDEEAIKYVQQITGVLITNPIIISPTIPLEMLLANDYYSYKNNLNYNFVFKGSTDEEVMNNTSYFGLQATSSTIHTTRLLYENIFNLTRKQSADLITFDNFPIPVLFPIISRLEADNTTVDYSTSNQKEVEDLYKYYNISLLNNSTQTKGNDYFLLDNMRTMSKDGLVVTENNNNTLIIALSTSLSLVLLIVIGIVLFFVIKKKKENKNKKSQMVNPNQKIKTIPVIVKTPNIKNTSKDITSENQVNDKNI